MKSSIPILLRIVPLLAMAMTLSGCLNLKPAEDETRHFVLTAQLPVPEMNPVASNAPAIGLGLIRIPSYMDNPWMAVRKSDEEIVYLEEYQWAEPLNRGLERVIGTNLARLLGSGLVYLGEWRRESVDFEVYLYILHMEPDAEGKVSLQAGWRITLPAGSRVIQTGTVLIEEQGPRPNVDPAGAALTMSRALARLSEKVAKVVMDLALIKP